MIAWRQHLAVRADAAGLALAPELVDGLLEYLALLAMWNRRINLTAFDLSHPSDEACDRLIIEPVLAAAYVSREHRRAIDLGSGGGSPGIPLVLAAPWVEMWLVEVRSRKAAFLREAARTLMQVRIRVEEARFEAVEASQPFDVISFRAVRADQGLWKTVDRLLGPSGRVLWFGGMGHKTEDERALSLPSSSGFIPCPMEPSLVERQNVSIAFPVAPDVLVLERRFSDSGGYQ